MLKKFAASFLALVLIASVAAVSLPAVSLDAAAAVSNQTILKGLDKLRQKFPDGKYWNHYGSSAVNKDKWTNTPCPDGHRLNGVLQCNGQCDGFARKLGEDLFGVSPSKWQKKTTLDGLCVGDIIRYGNRHTIFVTGFTEYADYIIISDCNWDYHCGISWDRWFSNSRITSDTYYVLHNQNNSFTRDKYLQLAKPTLKISPNDYVVPYGMELEIKATYTNPLNAYDEYITWESSDPAIAQVYSSYYEPEIAYVYGYNPGMVTLTAYFGSTKAVKATCTVTVGEPKYEAYRIYGDDRVATAVQVSKVWDTADNVIISNGTLFADSLAGVPLASALEAPVLLTMNNKKNGLEQSVINRLSELKTKNVYILGGVVPVGQNIENQLKGLGYTVKRIAGETRYETSVKISEELEKITGGSDEVFVVSGENYPDALSISSVAGILKKPIVFAAPNGTLNPKVEVYLNKNSFKKATVIGGKVAVDTSVEGRLKNCKVSEVKRIYGDDRFITCIKVLNEYKTIFEKGEGVFLATGNSFPDALSGGALAAWPKLL